ncbi:MAG: membrane protein insertase YidC [Thermodesulfobacteriota bacterium]|nr:membrane protein insertase YidC [Thermodesulfobacteriota bacterium]
MDKRTFAAIVLSFAVIAVYQLFFAPTTPPPQPEAVQKTEKEIVVKSESREVLKETLTRTTPSIQEPINGKDIKVESPLYSAIFTTIGGNLKSFKLKGYCKTLDENSELIELVNIKSGIKYPLAVTFPESSINISPEEIYQADADSIDITRTMDARKLTFVWSYPEKIKVEKIFTFYPEKYSFDLEVKVYNISSRALNENALLSWYQSVDPEADTSRYSHDGPISFVKNSLHLEKVDKLETRKLLGPDVSWGAFENKYFIAAMIPQKPSLTSLVLFKDSRNLVSVGLEGPKNLIPPGQSGFFNYSLYLGPKDYDILKTEDVGLENSIDFGSWIKWLALPLLIALKFLYQYVHNYGIAIIILTILIKVLFWPLGNKSYRSMKEMQKLQPMLKKLQEKYKEDKQKLSEETMALYKRYKVNPLGGCLPMVIQIPVFFGLYKALLYSIELRHSPFFWWIQDLSAKDPYYITPIIMGATMFLQQKMTPPVGGNPMHQKMMLWMPVVFTFLFLSFPSGLVIYWLFSNILSIGQQHYINKQ